MSEFEDILQKTNAVRKEKISLEEHTDALAKMLGIRIRDIFEQHQKAIHTLNKELRNRLYEAVREGVEKSIKDVEDYPKGLEL
jgi:DNA anti-recombination protein RmuC